MQEKRTVLHIVSSMSWRGGEQQVAYLIEELKDKIDQFVLCSEGSLFEAHCKKANIPHFSQRKKGGLDLAYARRIKNICKGQQISLCHMHDAHAHTFAILAAAVFGNNTPLVLSRRVDFPIKNSWFSKYKYNHKAIQKILCVSAMIKEITARGIKDNSKLEVVYSGIDLQKFQESDGSLRRELGIPSTAFLVGNTSALADHKDYFTFLDVAEEVLRVEPSVYFVVLGDGPLKKEIHDYAKGKTQADRIIFAGFREDIPKIIKELDLFLITSKTEGLGTSILDAFASQIPVVATAAGGIPELVEDGRTGLLCPVKEVNQLVNAVQQLKQNEVLRKELVTKAYEKVQSFSKKNTAEATLKVYATVLS